MTMRALHYWLQSGRVTLSLAIRYCLIDRALRRVAEPTLTKVLRGSFCAVTDVSELFRNLDFIDLSAQDFIGFKNDFVDVKRQLENRYELVSLQLPYPVSWAIEKQSSLMLYTLVRALKPETVVETGVGNGHSSFVILSALKRNSRGKLVSVDIHSDVGRLVSAEEGELWELHLLSRPGASDELRAILQSFRPVDLFVHDSNHLYESQMTEYRAAATILSDDGILVSDDIDLSYAFWDFCCDRGLKPAVLIDERKALGVVRLTPL